MKHAATETAQMYEDHLVESKVIRLLNLCLLMKRAA